MQRDAGERERAKEDEWNQMKEKEERENGC